MIKAVINGEEIVLTTSVENLRDETLYKVSDEMDTLIWRYREIANEGTEELKYYEFGGSKTPNKTRNTFNERTLRYIAEKVLKDENYTLERIDTPEATAEEIFELGKIY